MQETTEKLAFQEIEKREDAHNLPEIIQGGMGFGVSNYELAGEVAKEHELGVISGTATGMLLARRLEDGHEASREVLMERFPDKEITKLIIDEFFIEGGKPYNQPYKTVPMLSHKANPKAEYLNLAGAFVEVALAKEISEGKGKIGMNMLTKLEEPTLSALYGAMLADVDVVIMGAGIPKHIPKAIDQLSKRQTARLPLTVTGSTRPHEMLFNPDERYEVPQEFEINRPSFLAIVSSNVLARSLVRNSNPNPPDGFVVERHIAGGHNAPPRNKNAPLNERGEPIYDEVNDEVDFDVVNSLGLPYWLAGGSGTPEGLKNARKSGANGIQAGSIFALTRESGIKHEVKLQIVKSIMQGEDIDIYTDPLASPTGFPFKVAQLGDSISESSVYDKRVRICDLGYLREKYEKPNGDIGYRCASEPINDYLRKGGSENQTIGRKCLCNALAATIDMPQYRPENGKRYKESVHEDKIVTLGNDVNRVVRVMMSRMQDNGEMYTAKDVLEYLRSED